MTDELLIQFGEKLWCRADRNDVRWCAERKTLPDPNSFQGILRQLLLAGFCLLFLVGCSTTPKFTVETITPSQFTVTVDGFTAKQDDTLSAIKENTDAIGKIVVKVQSLESAILETRKTLGASLVKSEAANGQEVITSEDTSPDKNANDSHPSTGSVAESGDVALFVSVAPFCKPCESLKKDWKDGKLKGFAVTFCVQTEAHRDKLIADGIPAENIRIDTWQHPDGFPAIRYPSSETSSGYAVWTPRGYGPRILMELRSTLLGEETPVVREFPQVSQSAPQSVDLVELHNQLHGGGNWTWPGDLAEHLRNVHGVQIDGNQSRQTGGQFYRSRSVVRSVPQRSLVNWRSRAVSRSSCPTGGCP